MRIDDAIEQAKQEGQNPLALGGTVAAWSSIIDAVCASLDLFSTTSKLLYRQHGKDLENYLQPEMLLRRTQIVVSHKLLMEICKDIYSLRQQQECDRHRVYEASAQEWDAFVWLFDDGERLEGLIENDSAKD